MKKIIFFLFPFVLVGIFFKPFFFNHLLPIPSDTIIGLYNPFRDFYAKEYPRGIPFKNFLITDPVRQQYPWRKLSIDIEKNFRLPLWNPYNFSGTPLLANFQSAVFYPLNLELFIVPFSFGWSFVIFLQPLLAGIFLYLYLQKIRLSQSASLFGGFVFSFCGFSVAWMEWNTLVQVALWLPFILLAKEYLLQKLSLFWIIILIFAEISQIFAGHVQILFYSIIISNIYLIGRIVQISFQTKQQRRLSFAIKKYIPFLCIGVFIYTITAIQWIPALQFIHFSARDIDQSLWQKEGWFIPWENLIQFVAPDFFGNPTTLNYWGVFNYAEFVGYIGILPFVFALFAMFFRYDKKTFFFGSLFFLSLLFALPTSFAKLPFILNMPFISTSQPTRLLFVTDFSLAILAALGLDYFAKEKKKILIPLFFLGLVFSCLWVVILFGVHILPISQENISIAKHNLILPTIIFSLSAVILLCSLSFTTKRMIIVMYSLFILITIFDLFRFAHKFLPFTSQAYLFPTTKTISFLQKHVGNYRIMTTDSRMFPPNFSIMYHVQSVDGYDPLFLTNYAELIAASERGNPDITPPFGFNRIVTPHNYNSKLMDLLGVKYVLSVSDISSPKLKKVFQEGETRVYENTNVLPRAFFVSTLKVVENQKDAVNTLFKNNFDQKQYAVITDSGISIPFSLVTGTVTISQYSENTITLQTETQSSHTKESFLVLTDVNYPTWHATVDGIETRIFTTDFALRGIVVPSGKHTIVFSDTLF